MARPKGVPFSEEYASANYAEFSVTQKPDRAIKTLKALLLLLYVAVSAGYCTVALVLTKMGGLIAILPLLLFILWLVTWRFTKVEWMYIVCQGMFHVYRVNGFNRAKEVFCRKISENEGICPASQEDYAELERSCVRSMECSAGKGTEDRYFACFEIDGKRTALYFTAAARLLTGLRYYGGDRVIVTYVSR